MIRFCLLWLALLALVKMKLYLLKFCLSKSFLLRSYPLCLFIKNINSRKKMIICRQFQTMLCWYTYFQMICVFDGEVWEVFDWGSSCFWVYNPNFKISNRELVSQVSKQKCMEGKKTKKHCVKNVQIRNFFWSVFSCIWTEYRNVRPEKTPYLDTFHAVKARLLWVPNFIHRIDLLVNSLVRNRALRKFCKFCKIRREISMTFSIKLQVLDIFC